jgi:uncharacterized protein YukE
VEALDRSIKQLERKLHEVKVEETEARLKEIEKSMPTVQESHLKAREQAGKLLAQAGHAFQKADGGSITSHLTELSSSWIGNTCPGFRDEAERLQSEDGDFVPVLDEIRALQNEVLEIRQFLKRQEPERVA